MSAWMGANGLADWVECCNCGVLQSTWREDTRKRPWCDACWAERNKHAAILDVLREAVPLRDYFAGLAMQALWIRGDYQPLKNEDIQDGIAIDAYVQADAMLRAREKKDEADAKLGAVSIPAQAEHEVRFRLKPSHEDVVALARAAMEAWKRMTDFGDGVHSITSKEATELMKAIEPFREMID